MAADYKEVEKPFIDQLVSQGWKFLAGSVEELAVTHRESYTKVMTTPMLCEWWRALISTMASFGWMKATSISRYRLLSAFRSLSQQADHRAVVKWALP